MYLYVMTADLMQLLQGGGAVPKVYIFAKGSFSRGEVIATSKVGLVVVFMPLGTSSRPLCLYLNYECTSAQISHSRCHLPFLRVVSRI